MKKGNVILILVACVLVGFYVFVSQKETMIIDAQPVEQDMNQVEDVVGDIDRDVLSEDLCTESGGEWNACGSACRTHPGDVCIELCVEYCECEEDAQCPLGYTCGDFIDEVGVCL